MELGRTMFADLPAPAFPFTIELLDAATMRVVWEHTADGAGAVRIPAAAELGCERVESRVTFADGTVAESWS